MGEWEWRILGKSGAGLLAEFLTDLEKGNAEEGGELGDPPVETHGDGEGEEEAEDDEEEDEDIAESDPMLLEAGKVLSEQIQLQTLANSRRLALVKKIEETNL